jgi:cytidylate kinase
MQDPTHEPIPARIAKRIDAQLATAERIKQGKSVALAAPAPFITISRQFGCEAMLLAEQLAPRLAALDNIGADNWPIYNRQFIEGLSAEEHLSARIIDALDVRARSGIEEFFQTLIGKSPPDIKVLHHLVRCERAVATLGRCIIVGRGGALLTAELPGGIHVRLVAPEAWRLNNLVARFGWDEAKAHVLLREEEHNRHSFYQKYLGQDPNNPEHYDLILNTSRMNRAAQVESIAAIFSARHRYDSNA